MNIRPAHLIASIAIAALLGYWVGKTQVDVVWRNYQPHLSVVNKEPPATVQTVDFSLFWTVWDKVGKLYFDKKSIDGEKLLYGAISGMMESLGDPYTVFLPPSQNTSFKQGLSGQFDGIGAELGMKEKQVVVVAPLHDSPAQKAGIEAGDVILKVNEEATAGWTLVQTVQKIRGTKGTPVTLTLLHKGKESPTNITVVRDTIRVKSVEGWVKRIEDIPNIRKTGDLKGKEQVFVAYIRLSQFGDDTNKEWLSLANTIHLKTQSDTVKGVILDLRNNPGGYLNEATFIASEFITDGVVVVQERGNGEKKEFTVSRKGLLTDMPIIVLVNKGSASASEIVAAALKQHREAVLVGETSFGKGTIQQAEDLGNGVGLHITIAKWLTPKGEWIHGKGLVPDVTVANDENDRDRDAQLEKAVEELVQ